jgi:tRNA (guanine-N7-)-methyltransferase
MNELGAVAADVAAALLCRWAKSMTGQDDEGGAGAGDSSRHELRSFGRRHGRKLSPRQAGLMRDLLPRLAVDLACPPPQPIAALFDAPVAEHLLWQATRSPEAGLLGCEPFDEGVAKALAGIADGALGNIRLHPDDARPLLRWLPNAAIGRAFILFPDPWPKRKHVKRRLINAALLDDLARVMRPGAVLRVGTDIGDYARTILRAVTAHDAFRWTARRPADWRERGADWPQTRYEQKALREGRRGYFFEFARR